MLTRDLLAVANLVVYLLLGQLCPHGQQFGCYWAGGASHCEAPTDIEQHTDVSLVSGRLRHFGTTTTSDDVSQQQAAVVKRDEQMTVADNAAGM